MKRVLALIFVLIFSLLALAIEGKVSESMSYSLSGTFGFKILFDEQGIQLTDVTDNKDVGGGVSWSVDLNLSSASGDAKLEIKGNYTVGVSTLLNSDFAFSGVSYEDNILTLDYVNSGYTSTFSDYTIKAWDRDGDDSIDAIGEKYISAGIKEIGIETLFISLVDAPVTEEATGKVHDPYLAGKILAVKKSLSLSELGDLTVAGAFWYTNETTPLTPDYDDATKAGYAVHANMGMLDNTVGVDVAYTNWKKNSMLIEASYKNDFDFGVTVTPHVDLSYIPEDYPGPFVESVSAASNVALGVDLTVAVVGTLTLSDTYTQPFGKSDPTLTWTVEWSYQPVDFVSLYVKLDHSAAKLSEVASPIELYAKATGEKSVGMVTLGYTFEYDVPKVSEFDTYTADVNLNAKVKPMDLLCVSAEVYYFLDSTDKDTSDNFVYMVTTTYKYTDFVELGVKVGNWYDADGDTYVDINEGTSELWWYGWFGVTASF